MGPTRPQRRDDPLAPARSRRRAILLGVALAMGTAVLMPRGPIRPEGRAASTTDSGPGARPTSKAVAAFPQDALGAVRDPMYQVPYNGRFTFTRLRYGSGGRGLARFRRGWSNAWNHDYPAADRNMQVILEEFTSMRPNTGGSNILDLENPEIFKHPILYMSEPGFWAITDDGANNLRQFLLKGGMLIFDDFEADQWYNMAAQVARALPEGEWFEIDGSHPVFQGVFIIEDIYVPHPLVAVTPRYMAIFEDDDPSGRVMVLANHNSDLAEYWEYSTTGYFPVDPTNDAYRVGVNEIVYGMTH